MNLLSGFIAFSRRELREQVRTFRLVAILAAFVLIGIASPLLAKLTPEILSRFGTDELGGLEFVLVKEPDATDGLFQYQKNLALLPLLVILTMMGAVAGEKTRGTAAMSLVKPVSRTGWLLAKAAVSGLVLLAGTILGAILAAIYTTVLFGEIDIPSFLMMNALVLLTLWAWLSVTLLGSTLMPGIASSGGFSLGVFVLVTIAGSLPPLARFTPAGLGNVVVDLVLGRVPVHLGTSLTATLVFIAVPLAVASWVLQRQEL